MTKVAFKAPSVPVELLTPATLPTKQGELIDILGEVCDKLKPLEKLEKAIKDGFKKKIDNKDEWGIDCTKNGKDYTAIFTFTERDVIDQEALRAAGIDPDKYKKKCDVLTIKTQKRKKA